MTMLEKAARAAEECMTAHISSSVKYDAEYIGESIARAVLEAVRMDDWSDNSPVERLWMNTDLTKFEMQQFDFVLDEILTEGKSNDPE